MWTIANYNGTAHDGLNGRTPLEAMQFLVAERKVVLRTLPNSLRSRIHQLQPAYMSTVRGNPARGIAPYINLYGARYSNEILERTTGLLKTQIRVYMNPDDMREACWRYLPNEAPNWVNWNVLSGWRYSRHTVRLRQHILFLRRCGKFAFDDEQDPIAIYSHHQRSKIKRSRKEATRTAQVMAAEQPATQAPIVESTKPSVRKRADAQILAFPLPGLDVQNF